MAILYYTVQNESSQAPGLAQLSPAASSSWWASELAASPACGPLILF